MLLQEHTAICTKSEEEPIQAAAYKSTQRHLESYSLEYTT